MRSIVPIEGDPWPHDMTISIEDHSQALLELLWVRETWSLEPIGDEPGPLIDGPEGANTPSDVAEWSEAWSTLWEGALAVAAQPLDASAMDSLQASAAGSSEHAELLARLTGPTWRGRFGGQALEAGFSEWSQRQFEKIWPPRHTAAESPERLSLDALVPAWRAGLERVVTIPCRAEHTRVVGTSGLLVTDGTREDPALYAEALGVFSASR